MCRRLLVEEEVRNELQLADGTLASWRNRGRGPTWIRVGGLVRYRRADVDAWLDAHAVTPAA